MSTTTLPTDHVDPRSFKSFAEFYPFYLGEHSNRTCRRLHFLGSTLALVCLATAVWRGAPQYLLYALLSGYGFAWIGHFVFEKNKPASFKRPLYSFMGDWRMYAQIWAGKIRF
ncbi:MAG: Mpo1-like protein [Pseudomonadota bacterium]